VWEPKFISVVIETILPLQYGLTVCHRKIQLNSVKQHHSEEEREITYSRLYVKIIACIVYQIGIKYCQFEKLECFQLLQPSRYEEYKNQFPDTLLEKFLALYGSLCDRIGLKNELTLLPHQNSKEACSQPG